MVNKIVLLNTIGYLGPPLCHCRGPLYKIGCQAVFTTALTYPNQGQAASEALTEALQSDSECYTEGTSSNYGSGDDLDDDLDDDSDDDSDDDL